LDLILLLLLLLLLYNITHMGIVMQSFICAREPEIAWIQNIINRSMFSS